MTDWDSQAVDLESARRAVWSDPGYDDSIGPCLDLILPHLPLDAGSLLLDHGCGIGRLTTAAAVRYPQVRLFGVDTSTRMLQHAIEQSAAVANVSWWPSLDTLAGRYMDGAWSMLTFQHCPADVVAEDIATIGRLLRSGGVFRFQLVEGDAAAVLDHRHQLDDVGGWLTAAGFEMAAADRGVMFEEWTWVTAKKR